MPSLHPPILALLLLISSSTLFIPNAVADDGEAITQTHKRVLQSKPPANGGGGNAASQPQPKPQTPTSVSGGSATGKRKKGGHRKMVSEFIKAHNEVRAKYGEPPLKWNKTLEIYAQQWAAIRASDCQLLHAPENHFGENLFWGKYRHWTPRQVVKQWADEVAFYNSKDHRCAQSQQCGHYTQIVWRSSSWIGCAKQVCLNGEVLVVCEYYPAGNFLDTPDPFTAKTSYPGEENNIPRTSGPNMTNIGTSAKPKYATSSSIGTSGVSIHPSTTEGGPTNSAMSSAAPKVGDSASA